jgi:hypothetical protein
MAAINQQHAIGRQWTGLSTAIKNIRFCEAFDSWHGSK